MTDDKKNLSLEDVMEKESRHTPTLIDLTRPMEEVSTNETEAASIEEKESIVEANVIQNGHVDSGAFETMATVDPLSILPKKAEEASSFEDDLFSALDKAVEKEKESITERINAITEVQRQEFEEKIEAEEAIKQEADDNFALYGIEGSDDPDANYTLDLGLDEREEDSDEDSDYEYDIESEPVQRISMIDGPSDKEVEMESTTVEPIIEETVANEVETDELEKEVNTEEEHKVTIKQNIDVMSTNILGGVSNDNLGLDDDDNEVEDVEDSDQMFEKLKKEVKEKIVPIKRSLDLSKFTIAQKSINASKVMKLAIKNHQTVADWVMYAANRPISVSGLSGQEILKLNPDNSSRNRLNTFRDMYRIIYDHIFDGNKPEFETWLKQTRFIDIPHIQFALYMATFQGSNFITYSCDKCKKVFIKDIDFKDMVEYASDEAKEKVQNMLRMDTTSPSEDTYDVDLVQISDNYVFGLRVPSVWNVIIETASLSDAFISKYEDLIDIVSYIDNIYMINYDTQELVRIDTKNDPNDQAKSSARRIKIFHDIISKLTSEELYSLRAKIGEYDKTSDDVTYLIPACTCPDCAAEIPANKDMSPDMMLFTRHQLAAIGNM